MSFRVTMSSACAQLCLRCRGLLCPKSSTRLFYVQVQHGMNVGKSTRISNRLLSGGNHTVAQSILSWKQQRSCYYDYTAKYLTTESKESKPTYDLSRTDVTDHKPALLPTVDSLPLTPNQIYLGMCLFLLLSIIYNCLWDSRFILVSLNSLHLILFSSLRRLGCWWRMCSVGGNQQRRSS